MAAALVLAFAACDNSSAFNSDSSTEPQVGDQGIAVGDPATMAEGDSADAALAAPGTEIALASSSFDGGIPIGFFAQPNTAFGSTYNGAMRNDAAGSLRSNLAIIKSRGGKIIMNFSGSERYFKNSDGTFSLTKWKQRIERYKGVDINSYISDGTIIGHYLIDEPNDPANWSGHPISASTVDEMARISKQIWPNLATIARVEPGYFNSPRYLDAAWAQYLARRGNVNDYIRKVVSDAQDAGLGLVVGLNPLKGGTPNGTRMTASEVENFGSALLSSTYPCAFVSWTWTNDFSGGSMKDAMTALRRKAESRSMKSCRG
ncbi:MAG TPA: hypothetical protein VMY76_10775 [Gemmatimonadales bacterium]|nr:hypothetical protein [Gemmatimonadales bacterium]